MKFECWEFFGNGDRFFGGNADDRVLYVVDGGAHKFLRGCDYAERKTSTKAVFESCAAAKLAGANAVNWRGGLLSGVEHRQMA